MRPLRTNSTAWRNLPPYSLRCWLPVWKTMPAFFAASEEAAEVAAVLHADADEAERDAVAGRLPVVAGCRGGQEDRGGGKGADELPAGEARHGGTFLWGDAERPTITLPSPRYSGR